MIGAIELDIFHLQVGVFADDESRLAFLKDKGVSSPENDHSCFASAHMDCDETGRAWFSMVIKSEASKATWAHECVHIADFVMDRLGIPCDAANTEVRGYLVGYLFGALDDMIGPQ